MNTDTFELNCLSCHKPVVFSLADLDETVCCTTCGQKYGLHEQSLKRQLKQFASLCTEIRRSEDILGDAGVAVEVGPNKVVVPFKILLTRLKSTLNLQMGQHKLVITFRTQTT